MPKSNLGKHFHSVMAESDFGESLNKAIEMGPDFTAIVRGAAEVTLSPTTVDSNDLTVEIASQLGKSPSQIRDSIDAISFFLVTLAPDGTCSGDDIDDLVADLIEAKIISDDTKQLVARLLKTIQDHTRASFGPKRRRRAAARSTFPLLSRTSTEADFRAIFEKRLMPETPLADYRPICIGVVPLGVIHLGFVQDGVESAQLPSVSFQVDVRTLDLLIKRLSALRVELDAAQAALGLENEDEEG